MPAGDKKSGGCERGTLTILSTHNDFGFDMKLQGGNLVHGDIGTASSWLTTTADTPYNYRLGECLLLGKLRARLAI